MLGYILYFILIADSSGVTDTTIIARPSAVAPTVTLIGTGVFGLATCIFKITADASYSSYKTSRTVADATGNRSQTETFDKLRYWSTAGTVGIGALSLLLWIRHATLMQKYKKQTEIKIDLQKDKACIGIYRSLL